MNIVHILIFFYIRAMPKLAKDKRGKFTVLTLFKDCESKQKLKDSHCVLLYDHFRCFCIDPFEKWLKK